MAKIMSAHIFFPQEDPCPDQSRRHSLQVHQRRTQVQHTAVGSVIGSLASFHNLPFQCFEECHTNAPILLALNPSVSFNENTPSQCP
mmetsp:Transcript_22380/g.33829  ORF Transcript_22380/g.33829 Transcript_22380/m.33829 type:complete len:87 (+) Transcript_22380:69-329(+)